MGRTSGIAIASMEKGISRRESLMVVLMSRRSLFCSGDLKRSPAHWMEEDVKDEKWGEERKR